MERNASGLADPEDASDHFGWQTLVFSELNIAAGGARRRSVFYIVNMSDGSARASRSWSNLGCDVYGALT